MPSENLLFYQVMKLIYDNGTIYLIPEENDGHQKIKEFLSPILTDMKSDPSTVTTAHFRKIFKTCWDDVLDELVPYEAQTRVSKAFKTLIF